MKNNLVNGMVEGRARRFARAANHERQSNPERRARSDAPYLALLLAVGFSWVGDTVGQQNGIAGGREHSLAVRSDGQVWSFGDNRAGQLGNGTLSSSGTNSPAPISGLTNVVAVAAGGLNSGEGHSLVLKSDGSLWAFGTNNSGQLGIGSNISRTNSPVQITNLSSVMGFSAGGYHTLVVESNYTLWAFGQNTDGQLGLVSNTNTTKPAAVTNIYPPWIVTGGGYHSLVIDIYGWLWTFGKNNAGQLGVGFNSTNINYPVGIPWSLAGVAAGAYHSLALDDLGSVWATGTNGSGQLGVGVTNARLSSFTAVANLSNIVSVAAGAYHSLALKSDGTVWAWGRNNEGQLGLGTNVVSTNRPVQVPGLANVVSIAAGTYHSLAYTWDGAMWAFGTNSQGELGNHTTTNQFNPVVVSNFRFIRSWNRPYLTDQLGTPVDLFAANSNAANSAYSRPDGNQIPQYFPYVEPLDSQKGIALDPFAGNATNYFPNNPWTNLIMQIAPFPNGQFGVVDILTNKNPLAVFGSHVGGSPLYLGQPYRFDAHIGVRDGNSSPPSFRIYVYRKSDFGLVTNVDIALPPESDMAGYSNFVNQGVTTNAFGLRTVIKPQNNGLQEVVSDYSYFPYRLTHTCTNSDYYYEVDGAGLYETPLPTHPYVKLPIASTDINGAYPTLTRLYLLDFEPKPAWHSVFVDHPQFEVNPLPEAYQGKSLTELMQVAAALPTINITNQSDYLTLDNSPELRRHPILTNFVNDLRGDPIALANYVLNEIELTDTIPFNGNWAKLGGLNRSALGTFMEGQGSPLEQCALLVFLLRQSGTPATYVFPTNNGLQMLCQRMNRLLGMQVVSPLLVTNTTTVNWPWVAAWVKDAANPTGRWVHIFPWLKDVDLTEGWSLDDFLPEDYNNGFKWLTKFIEGDTNIMALSTESDQPLVLFPKFIEQTLLTNFPGVSIDDLGYQSQPQKKLYSGWDDFPRPFAVGSDITSLESLRVVTNIFNKVRVTIAGTIAFGITSPSIYPAVIDTGDILMCDILNRKLVVNSTLVDPYEGTGFAGAVWSVQASLAPYCPGITFTNIFEPTNNPFATDVVNRFVGQTNFYQRIDLFRWVPSGYGGYYAFDHSDYGDPTFQIKITYKQVTNAVSPIGAPQVWATNLVASTDDHVRNYDQGGEFAICFNVGNVTGKMLDVHAQELWQYEQSRGSSTNNEITQGTTMYLMGMSYFEQLSRFTKLNEQLYKSKSITRQSHLVTLLQAASNLGQSVIRPRIDVSYLEEGFISAFYQPTDPDWPYPLEFRAFNSCTLLSVAQGSAFEHGIINSFLNLTNGLSTMKLLQLAGKTNILHLTPWNYERMATNVYAGKALKDHDTNLWASVVQNFAYANATSNKIAFLTPGITTNYGFAGMGGLLVRDGYWQALITGLINGGVAPGLPVGSFDNSQLQLNPLGQYSLNFGYGNNEGGLASATFLPQDAGSVAYQVSHDQLKLDLTVNTYLSWANSTLNLQGVSPSDTLLHTLDWGVLNSESSSWHHDKTEFAADPVNALTGEFYIDNADLSLPGPMPLQVRRNYSSHNMAPNQFGYGWLLSYMPFLSLSTNDTTIRAAELDGSVIAYAPTNGYWMPNPALNPQLNNNSQSGLGNLFNATLVLTNGTNYLLRGPDGSIRNFGIRSYPVHGTNGFVLNRTRPYLDTWRDNRGNQYSFFYGSSTNATDYGELKRIESSNGSYLGFYYDAAGHIVEAYTGDGRRLYYDFDSYGDLVNVTLPDGLEFGYEYQHLSQTVTNGTNVSTSIYSTHLITAELKPDGRQLVNGYDSQRRVTNQWSTAGVDLNPVRTASFTYSNDFILTNSPTNGISGYTVMSDALGQPVPYYYTNSLITNIVDQLGQTNRLEWYFTNDASVWGYQRSLKSQTDKRSLLSRYFYDTNGNLLTNLISGADLTGNGTNDATNAIYVFAYGVSNLLTQTIDPVGHQTFYRYADTNFGYLPTAIEHYASNGVAISTNLSFYTNFSNQVTVGTNIYTYSAFGVRWREIRAANSPDAATTDWMFDGRGYPTNQVRYTGTEDPDVATQFIYNDRGKVRAVIDAAGRRTEFGYDDMDRPISKEIFEAGQSIPSRWEYSYYNANGELEWWDGPASAPEDYIYRAYDGAGRKNLEMHWRAQAKADGSGLDAPVGDELFSTMSFVYDVADRQVAVIDPRGVVTTNTFDAIGQLLAVRVIETNGTFVSTNSFAYEPGGQVTFETNALGGWTEKRYTSTGKLKYRRNADGSTNTWRYWLDGRLRRESLSNGAFFETYYTDANRWALRTSYTRDNSSWWTNRTEWDRRGNVIRTVDEVGATSTNIWDGLDRLKAALSPMVKGIAMAPPDGSRLIVQEAVTNYYDAAGIVTTNVNALGDQTITFVDAAGRPARSEIRDAAANLVRLTTTGYSFDGHSVTVTNGSGTNAIISTTYTDNDGHTVLTVGQTILSALEYALQKYNVAGNRIVSQQCSITNGQVTIWATNGWTFNGLHQMMTETVRDGATTTYTRDALGNPLTRAMPNGVTWSATYTSDGRILSEQDSGTGGLTAHSLVYQYYDAPSEYAGKLKTVTDGRGVTRTNAYEYWLRLATVTTGGSGVPDEQKMILSYQYDNRSLWTSLTQSYANSNTGPQTIINRVINGARKLSNEWVYVGGAVVANMGLGWDNAGRRTGLSESGAGQSFTYQADGLLTGVNCGSFTNAGYSYGDNGYLNRRYNGVRDWQMNSRDGMGHLLQATTYVRGQTVLTETMTWQGDGRQSSYSAIRGTDFTDSRNYTYSPFSQFLTNETLYLGTNQPATNAYVFDFGQAGGVGVLTKGSSSGAGLQPALWTLPTNGLDGLRRVVQQTNSLVKHAATGLVNGPANLTGILNSHPISVEYDSTSSNGGRWTASLDLAQGTNTLAMTASLLNGMYSTNATSQFVNTDAGQTVTNAYDGNGNTTVRGCTNWTETFVWDAFNRLVKETWRDKWTNGYDWTCIYDGLGRRVRTIHSPIVSNIYQATVTIDSSFDPNVEFQEVEFSVNGKRYWKVYGPDLNGAYGGLQGIGGLEAMVEEAGGATTAYVEWIVFGNIVGTNRTEANASFGWLPVRYSSYGPVPGYQTPSLSLNCNPATCPGWLGKLADPTGRYFFGGNDYQPDERRWLRYDSMGWNGGPNPYSFCNNSPGFFFDPDGRCGVDLGAANRAYVNAVDSYFADRTETRHREELGDGIDSLASRVVGLAHAQVYSEQQSEHYRNQLDSGADMGWVSRKSDFGGELSCGQQWKYNTTDMFERTLKSGAEWSVTLASLPVSAWAGVAERALASEAGSTFLTRVAQAEIGLAERQLAAETTSTLRFSAGAGDSLAAGSQQLLNDTIFNNPALYGVKLTQYPIYNPNLTYFGQFSASGLNNFSIEIGPKAFANETELVGTIVHEETHLRFFERLNSGGARASAIDAAGGEEAYVRAVEARFLRMKGLLQ